MLANRPGSSTRQGRLIFSAPATSPSSGRSAVSLHTRTKLRQFNSWSAVEEPYLQKLSYNLRGCFSDQSGERILEDPHGNVCYLPPRGKAFAAAKSMHAIRTPSTM